MCSVVCLISDLDLLLQNAVPGQMLVATFPAAVGIALLGLCGNVLRFCAGH